MPNLDIDLLDLQSVVVGAPKDLILPEEFQDSEREEQQARVRKIVDMYQTCRNNNRIYKSTYDALDDVNPFVRVAAIDLIGQSGTTNSFDYLFKALEDEDNIHVKREIAIAIDRLEARLHNKSYVEDENREVSFMKSMKILKNATKRL